MKFWLNHEEPYLHLSGIVNHSFSVYMRTNALNKIGRTT